MSIELFFREFLNEEIEKKIKNYKLIRLMGWVSFRTYTGMSDPQEAIIDTGAPTSVIPFSMWKELPIIRITTHKVQRINPKPECSIPIIIGKVKCVLLDERGNQTKETEIHAYLALTDEVPLILGFKDLLTEFRLCFSYPDEAWIEERQ